MADRIVVLRAGNVEQVGSPIELYRAPRNLFVAGFIGSPQMNLIQGAEAQKRGAETIGVRPEHIRASHHAGDWAGTVGIVEHLGSDTILHVSVDGVGMVKARVEGEFRPPRPEGLSDAGSDQDPSLQCRREDDPMTSSAS